MQLTENYDSYIAASGDEPGAAIFMSVFFIKIGFVPIGAEQDVRHPVRRSAHLLANHTQVNVRAALVYEDNRVEVEFKYKEQKEVFDRIFMELKKGAVQNG